MNCELTIGAHTVAVCGVCGMFWNRLQISEQVERRREERREEDVENNGTIGAWSACENR